MPSAVPRAPLLWLFSVVAVWCVGPAEGQRYRTDRAFRRQIHLPIAVTWSETPLAEALESLSTSHRVAIFLDRRIDPSQTVTASTDMLPFGDTLKTALKPLQLGVGYVGSVVYVGPRNTAARIATLAELRNEQSRQQPTELRQQLLTKRPVSWDELSEPRALVTELVRRTELEFTDQELIPHDQWKAVELPPMTVPESLTLILAGFNMNFTLQETDDGTQFRLTRFPIGVAIERSYDGGPSMTGRIAEIEELFPHAVVEQQGSRLSVRSLLEDHWALEDRFASQDRVPQRSAGPAKRAYTLRVENKPAGKVLEILANQLGWSIEFDSDTEAAQEQLVSFSVDQVRSRQLLEAAAEPANLKVTIDGDRVKISQR